MATSIVASTYETDEAGSRYLAVERRTGHPAGSDGWARSWSVLTEAWAGDPDRVAADLVAFAGALDATVQVSDDWGVEHVWESETGLELRICAQGSYLRVGYDVDDDGPAYWTQDEFAEEPVLVVGALVGVLLSGPDL